MVGLGDYGLAWGVVSEGVRIMPGGQLALNVGDSYFIRELSQLPEVLPAGAEIYAQVDSAKVGSDHGAVFEGHELRGEPYNNIKSIRLAEPVATGDWLANASVAKATSSDGLSMLPSR